MSKNIDLNYPKPEDATEDLFPHNPYPVKVTTTNLIVGMFNLYKALFFHILIITILLIPLYSIAQDMAKSMNFYFIYRPLDIRYDILPSLTFEYLVSWIPMIYIMIKAKEYHEENWKSTQFKGNSWNPFGKEAGETLIQDLNSKYRYILLIIILSIGFALINLLTFIILILFDHLLLQILPTTPHSPEYEFTMIFFRTATKALLLARFGLAPMFLICGDDDILQSLKSSWDVTEEDPLLLYPILLILQFLTYLSPIIFGMFNYLLIATAYYLLHPLDFPRGRIWPLSAKSTLPAIPQ